MRILLTSFTTFGDHHVNPSRLAVEALDGHHADVITAVLPVEYSGAEARIRALIARHEPDAILMLGLAARRGAINLERFALNIDDAPLPDNAGVAAAGRPIVADGPPAYTSTLPLPSLLDALQAKGIPAVISNHAGTYVCNHVFYVARHLIEQTGSQIPCGFVHVPQIASEDDQPGLPLAALIEAVECCLDALRSQK
jgi:pyroglutamyl-peptidase